MKYLSIAMMLLAFPPFLFAQEKKDKDKPLVPIAEIKLESKEPVSYEKDVEPIFSDKCFVCHSGNVVESKFDMTTYAGVMKGGKRGPAIVPGKSADSFLYRVSGHREKPVMPLKGEDPLTTKELALLKGWIDQGAKAPTGVREKRKIAMNLPPDIVKPVRALAIHSGGKLIAIGRSNQIHLYDSEKYTPVKAPVDPDVKTPDGKPAKASHISLVESLAFSPDGKTLASGSFQEVVLWDVASAAIRLRIPGFADRVTALCYSADGKYLATGGGAATEDGELRIFSAADGKLVQDVRNAHSDSIFGIQFSPDGTKIASCGADKFVKVFEVPGGKLLKSFEGHTHHVLDVAWKPDGKVLASAGADADIKLWDYEKGEQLRTMKQAHAKQVTRLAFAGKTPNFLSVGADSAVKLWGSDAGNNLRNYNGNTDYLYALGVNEEGTLFAVGGEAGIVRIYKTENAQPVSVLFPAEDAKKK